MIKRTLFFGNPAYLSTKNKQLVINYPDKQLPTKNIPIEDIGYIILENPQITVSNTLLEKLLYANVALITCNHQHMPLGLLMPLAAHTEQNERFRAQLGASEPLKKNLWQQTVQAKIRNQAALLAERQIAHQNMLHWAKKVTSGDTQNHEARAAAYYWQHLFGIAGFNRYRMGPPPNQLLNYGYAILRAICARALTGSGLLPTLGIHHANKYNAYCLADDIMEPYRPFVDILVCNKVDAQEEIDVLSTDIKKEMLAIPALDVQLDGRKSPLMVAMSRTTHSLHECFMGVSRKLIYPVYGN